MSRGTIRVIRSPKADVASHLDRLRTAGYVVDDRSIKTPDDLERLSRRPPRAVVIDLSRAPAWGRDLALGLRQRVATHALPIVFVEGDESTVGRIKKLLPDARFTTWRRVWSALTRAIARTRRRHRSNRCR